MHAVAKSIMAARRRSADSGLVLRPCGQGFESKAQALTSLKEIDYVTETESPVEGGTEWTLTSQGCTALRVCMSLADGIPVLACRQGVPNSEMTTFERMTHLGTQGWICMVNASHHQSHRFT